MKCTHYSKRMLRKQDCVKFRWRTAWQRFFENNFADLSDVVRVKKYQDFVQPQGFDFRNGRGALNCSPERCKESCQESDSYEHYWIVTILRWAKHGSSKRRLRRAEESDCSPSP